MKKGFRKEMEFMNKSNANKQDLMSWGYMWKFKLSGCIVYYEHELLHVCINSAVSKSFPIEIEFVDHETKSGVITSVRRRKTNSSLDLIKYNTIITTCSPLDLCCPIWWLYHRCGH